MWSVFLKRNPGISTLLFVTILSLNLFGHAFVRKEHVLLSVHPTPSSSAPSLILSSLLSSSTRLSATRAGAQPFNPFTTRNRNDQIKWRDVKGLGAFFDQHCNETLLTPKQEQQFGRAIQFWSRLENVRESLRQRFVGNLSSSATISDDLLAIYIGCSPEEIKKMRKYFEIAKRRLLLSNLKLVFSVVSRYRTTSISNSELILHGIVGLSQAVLRYDYSRGFRFATYATWYVHNCISDYVRDHQTTVEYPNKPLSQLRKAKKYMEEKEKVSDYAPTIGELAHALKIPQSEIRKALTRRWTPTRFEASLNGEGGSSGGKRADEGEREKTLGSTIPSLTSEPSEEMMYGEGMLQYVESLLETELAPEEKEILKMRLGMGEGRGLAVKEASIKSKVTWNKVKRLEAIAWGKLQSLGLDDAETLSNSIAVQQETSISATNSL